jgi:hypothetical protein
VLTGVATLQRMVVGRDSIDLEIGDRTQRVRLRIDRGEVRLSI